MGLAYDVRTAGDCALGAGFFLAVSGPECFSGSSVPDRPGNDVAEDFPRQIG